MSGRSRPIHGMVLAGDVDAVGRNVTSFEVRQSVFGFDRFGFGTYADADEVVDYTSEGIGGRGGRYDAVFVAVENRVGPPSRRDCRDVLVDGGVYRAVDRGRPVVTGAELTFLGELAETGHLTPAIDRTYPLAEIADAHRYVEAGHKRGNVVITIAGAR